MLFFASPFAGWISGGNSATDGGAAINDGDSFFKRTSFTLYTDFKFNDEHDNTSVVLVGPSADANFRIIPRKTDGTAVLKVNNGTEYKLSKAMAAGDWNALALVYAENDTEGTVAVYLNGEEVLAASGIGFKLSEKTGIVGAFGATYGTGFMRTGLYDNIVVTGTADAEAAKTETAARYDAFNSIADVDGVVTVTGTDVLEAGSAAHKNGLYRARAPHEVEWDIPAQTGPLPHKEAFFTMPVTKPCFGVAYREEPLAEGDLKRELLLDMLGDLVVGGLTKLYRRLYDEALVNPEFSGDFIAVRGACTVAFTGESDTPRQVVNLLQEEIERMRREGVDPEVFMLVKNQMYGELLGDVEAVDDAAEEAAAACLKGRTLADEIAALAALTVEDANALLQTALREENRAYVQIDPAEK